MRSMAGAPWRTTPCPGTVQGQRIAGGKSSLKSSALISAFCGLHNWYPDPTCPEVAKLWVVFDRGIDLLVI